jgi:hypothetical protein
MLRLGTALAQGDEVLKKHITHHDQGAGWKADLLMQKMMTSTDFYVSGIVQVKMLVLSKGRFVLVGDAGYAAGPARREQVLRWPADTY